MQKGTRQKLKLFTSLFFCAASLFSCVGLTLAWFSFNNDVTGNGIGVGAEKESDYLSCEYFAQDKNGVFAAVSEANASLGTYDLLNDNYRLLVKVKVRADAESVTVIAATDTKYFLGTAGTLLIADPKENDNPLSSVVKMRVATGEFASAEGGGYTWEKKPTTESYSTFIHTDIDGVKKPLKEVSFSAKDGGGLVTDTDGYKAVYILFSYDAQLVEEVFTANLGNEKIANLKSVRFTCDFRISVSTSYKA